MKKKFVFDASENDIINADEETIIKETGVSSENVKETVMKEIKYEGKQSKKKKVSKKKIFSVIAIAAAIAVVSTVSVGAATGGFNPVFSQLMAGEPANGVFPGKDITVTSDDVDIKFQGVCGDTVSAMAVYDITKKDGSAFVDDYDNCFFLGNDAKTDVTDSLWKKIWGGKSYSAYSGITYEMVDNKTIRAFAVCTDEKGGIMGERMTVKDEKVNVYHTENVLITAHFEEMSEYWDTHEEELNKLEKSLPEGQELYWRDMGRIGAQYGVATKITLNLNYELAFTMNYRHNDKSFDSAVGKKFTAFNTDWEVTNLTVRSSQMTLSVKTDDYKVYKDFDEANMENWDEETRQAYNSLETTLILDVTKKDGTKVIAIGYSGGGSHSIYGGGGTQEWECYFYENEDDEVLYLLDPNDIVSIKYNGTELL